HLTEDKRAPDSQLTLHELPTGVDNHDLLDSFNKSLQSQKKLNERYDFEYLDSLSSPLPISFNLAAYANKSPTLQKLIDLGVQLYEVERSKEACELILRLDFDRDIKKYLIFLHDIGIDPKNLGYFITKYPMIFDEEMENLETRVKYLQLKKFKRSAIVNILTQHPAFLSKSIYDIDSKLGFLQNQYNLSAVQIRKITEKWPFVVDISQQWHKVCLFMFKEEMGFNEEEMHNILVTLPSLFAGKRNQIVERFDLIHNEYGVSHELISRFPQVLQCNLQVMKERHLYLEKLKRVQYDPTKPCYIPLFSLTELISDTEFAEKYAKSNVADYNFFLKSI
ncbi:transcription termination factor 3-like protein, partial [Leptotrombidium deliense]